MNGWSGNNIALAPTLISGVVTAQPVSKEAAVTAGGALNGILKLTYSSVAQTGTITPKLQTALGSDWVDVKSGAAITADGTQYIRWNIEVAADQTVLPLLNKLRVVITTTNAADEIQLDSCELLQAL